MDKTANRGAHIGTPVCTIILVFLGDQKIRNITEPWSQRAISRVCSRLLLADPCNAYNNLFYIITSNVQVYLMRLHKLPFH